MYFFLTIIPSTVTSHNIRHSIQAWVCSRIHQQQWQCRQKRLSLSIGTIKSNLRVWLLSIEEIKLFLFLRNVNKRCELTNKEFLVHGASHISQISKQSALCMDHILRHSWPGKTVGGGRNWFKKMRAWWFYLPKSILAALLKMVSSHSSQVNSIVCISIFTKEMT